MPTGYTAGIIDGKTKTFQEFAKQCMKAFVACIHMRDADIDKEYEPRVPSDYDKNGLENAKLKLKKVENSSDEELIEECKKELLKSREHHLKRIDEIKIIRAKLEKFLKKAIKFKPPTKEHEEFRNFMIQQLQSTIDFDGKTEYDDNELARIKTQLKNLDAKKLRNQLMNDAVNDINYHSKKYREELKRCATSNVWVETLIGAINKIK